MPPVTTKKAQPVKFSSQYYDITVRDCMVWPDPSLKKTAKEPQTTYVLPTKGPIGKPTTRNFVLPENLPYYGAPVVDDGCHVVDAMRGWPKAQQEESATEEYDILRMSTPIEEEAKQRKKKKPKKPKKKNDEEEEKDFRRTGTLEEQGPDPDMIDLISHKFLTEAAKARIEERQRELYEQRMKIRRERDRRFPKDIKSTKTTQLRSIALAEKVDYRPQDLWQMPRFKDNAKPCLETFRQNKSQKKSSGEFRPTSGANGYACTCAEEQGGQAKYTNRYDDEYGEEPIDFHDLDGAQKIATSVEDDQLEARIPQELD